MPKSLIAVVRLSASFGDVWRRLGDGLDAEVQILAPGDVRSIPRTAAVLLAAGGAEREAMDWLDGREGSPGAPVMVAGADTGRRIASQLMAHGATDYFALPEDTELLRNAVAAAVVRHRAANQAQSSSRPETDPFLRVAGRSPALNTVLDRARQFARHPQGTALIVGETGTGKELLARVIHEGSPRRGSPFVPVNCSALPHQLIESELFGHDRGAFTDTRAPKPGLFEVADGGTLFLDELGALPVDLQAKLLRVLDDREIRRVGATKSRRVDVRVIAATCEDLHDAVRRNAFRQDLYYRLSVVTLELPPLRARTGDIPDIAEYLLGTLAATHRLPVPELNADARRVLAEYSWPGNVRELKNALERALLLSAPGALFLSELRPAPARWTAPVFPMPGELDAITVAAARTTLDACGGNVSEAARRLNISRARLRRLVNGGRQAAPHAVAGTT